MIGGLVFLLPPVRPLSMIVLTLFLAAVDPNSEGSVFIAEYMQRSLVW